MNAEHSEREKLVEELLASAEQARHSTSAFGPLWAAHMRQAASALLRVGEELEWANKKKWAARAQNHVFISERNAAEARATAAEAERDALRLQAECWAMEAKAHKSSLHEAYQTVTGATGEPGNWNGARPIVEAITALRSRAEALQAQSEAMRMALESAGALLDSFEHADDEFISVRQQVRSALSALGDRTSMGVGSVSSQGALPAAVCPGRPDGPSPAGSLIRQIARIEHTQDEGFCWPDDADDDARQTLDLLIAAARDISAEPLEAAPRPITMQDVRLAVGEGPLKPADVLAGCNAELRRRGALSYSPPVAEGE